jgi:predicted DNA binding CopG/RHH family protein
MKKRGKRRPPHSSEAAESDFWQRHDSVDFIDWKRAQWTRFPNLRTSTRTISLRLPESMLDELKALANQRDIPYQSLLKVFLAERIARERGTGAFRAGIGEGGVSDTTTLELR